MNDTATDGLQLWFDIRPARTRTEFRKFRGLNAMAGAANAARSARQMWLAHKAGLLSTGLEPDHAQTLDDAWARGGLPAAVAARSIALVAISDDEIVGGLTAGPSYRAISPLGLAAPDLARHAVEIMAKIHTITVIPEYQGVGIGHALIRRSIDTYTAAGAKIIYGQFTTATGQARFYSRCGLTVHTPATALSFAEHGLPTGQMPRSDETLFSIAL